MALTYQQAVVEIGDRANKRTFTDAAVQSLVLTFKIVNIKTPIAPSVVGGKVEPYSRRSRHLRSRLQRTLRLRIPGSSWTSTSAHRELSSVANSQVARLWSGLSAESITWGIHNLLPR